MSIRIGLGTGLGKPLAVDQYWRLAKFCEAHGLDSIWHSDQLLRPGLEPVAMLAALAAATTKLRFGMNAVVVSYRDPLILARECATIDYLAPGRLLPVFGVGDAADPVWKATGRSTAGRGERANECITLIRRLLSEDNVSFHGQHFQYQNVTLDPRPGRPIPIWIGGQSEAAIRRVAALGDGWLGGLTAPPQARSVVARIKAALKDTGRQIDEDHYGVVIPFRVGEVEDAPAVSFQQAMMARGRPSNPASPVAAVGDRATVISVFRQYIDAGISKFVAIPITADFNDLERQLLYLAEDICPEVED